MPQAHSCQDRGAMDAAADASSGQVRARGEDDDQPQPSKEIAHVNAQQFSPTLRDS